MIIFKSIFPGVGHMSKTERAPRRKIIMNQHGIVSDIIASVGILLRVFWVERTAN